LYSGSQSGYFRPISLIRAPELSAITGAAVCGAVGVALGVVLTAAGAAGTGAGVGMAVGVGMAMCVDVDVDG